MRKLSIKHFYDSTTSTISYIINCNKTKQAAIIDPVLNYERFSSKISYEAFNQYNQYIQEKNLKLKYILETHIHADHFTSSNYLRQEYKDVKLGIGHNINIIQNTFSKFYNIKNVNCDGSQFDILLTENDKLELGNHQIQVIETPGHTPNCITFQIDDNIFTGDALFTEDQGCGRCDFPGGSASTLYDSIQKLYKLSPETNCYTGHDYQPNQRKLRYKSQLSQQLEKNVMIPQKISKEEFVEKRESKDKTLPYPNLLLVCLQVNMNAGVFQKPEDNGTSYLKIPVSF